MQDKLKDFVTFSLPQRMLAARDALLAPGAMRFLLVSDREAFCSEQQFEPFFAHRGALRRKLNVVFHHRHLNDVLADPVDSLKGAHVVGLKLSFRLRAEEAVQIVQRIVCHLNGAKLIYFDGDDDSVIEWPEVLPWVDLYVKKQLFRDPTDYQKRFIGRNNLTDYVARKHAWDFSDNPIPASRPVDPHYLARVHLGYNIAFDKRIVALHQRTKTSWSQDTRPNDIVCRASTDSWLAPLRNGVGPALQSLEEQYRILLPTKRVDQATYDRELSQSKICICPFGYGELCWRDFEAILWGCLMVKPRMDAIRTRPDVFVPNETYVPVAWDLSDLAEKCRYYLEHPAERLRIVKNAYRTLSAFYEEDVFVQEVADILGAAQVPHPDASPASMDVLRPSLAPSDL